MRGEARGNISPRRERHKDLIEGLIRTTGEEGIESGDLYDQYEQMVDLGHPLVLPMEDTFSVRSRRKMVNELSDEGKVIIIPRHRGRYGQTRLLVHIDQAPEGLKRRAEPRDT